MSIHLRVDPDRLARERPAQERRPGPPPAGARRLLAVVDHAVQPHNIGDLLIYMTGSLVAAEEVGAAAIDFAFVIDPGRGHADPIMAELVARDGALPHLLAALPVLQLNPRLGGVHVFDRLADFHAFLLANQERYLLWPSREALAAQRYVFYDVFKAVHAWHQRVGAIPQVAFDAGLRGWVRRLFERHAEGRVPVTVNLRNNAGFHAHRNSLLPAWKAFFDHCRGRFPVTFLVTCAASEIDPGLRACGNVVYAKDHHSTVLQDLSLIRHAAFHLGAASGPAAMPIFGTSPYHIVHCDMLPHLGLYGGALLQSGPTELRYAFAGAHQTFGTEPETTEGLIAAFQRIWGSRDWATGETARRAGLGIG